MKKLLIKLALLAVPMLAAAQTADNLTKCLPSDWGGWQNLTYGVSDSTKYTTSLFDSQVVIEGQTIHLLWQESSKDAEGLYRIYYRRSTDLGRTWEQAQQVAAQHTRISNYNQNFMAVSGQLVHIIALDYQSQMSGNSISYIRSTDGGVTFTTRELASGAQYGGYQRQHIASDGQTVAITYSYPTGAEGFTYKTGEDYRSVHLVSSTDGGETFTDLEIAKQDVWDMKVQGNRIVLMGDSVGKIIITTSADGGKTSKSRNIAHVTPDGKSYAKTWSSIRYSHMSMDGQNVSVIYRGSLSDGGEGEPNPNNDLMHTIFQRSTDGGETWQEPMYIEGTCGMEPNIIASKGNCIYVLTCAGTGADLGRNRGYDAHITIFYSHDGGTTWGKQRRCFETYEGSIGSFAIAPDDPSGKHVVYTAQQGFYMESKDGFETVCRNFRMGDQSWEPYRDRNNMTLTVRFDQQGTEHWFMQYSPYKAGQATFDPYFWNICHRRVERPAESGSKEMAYHLTKTAPYSSITDIIVPMSPSIEATSEAITVEAWVRFDAASGSFHLAGQNNNSASLGGSTGRDGWYISLYYQSGGATPGGFAFDGCVHPETSNGVSLFQPWRYLIREMGQWHHVAMTYDSKIGENNVHFYIDGLPYRTITEHGKIKMGNNPILIGRNGSQADGDVLIDNFAIYSRALTLDEIHQHIYGKPDANDKDCRLLLTFDGTLRDQSQYHNDPVPLMNNPLEAHDGIKTPKADFTLTKDTKGTTVYVNNATPDGEVYWWWKPSPTTLGAYNESWKKHESVNYSGHSGNYTFWMVAKGDGKETNAFAPVSKQFSISGLSRVEPATGAQNEFVNLRIIGGYKLNYNNKPKVLLHNDQGDYEGHWLINYGDDNTKAQSIDDLPFAQFDLSKAPFGKYDVVVGSDTLYKAFELVKQEEPKVWVSLGGRGRVLTNRYSTFYIDYGNTSNTDAYNVPVYIIYSGDEDTDLLFDFDYRLYPDGIDDEIKKIADEQYSDPVSFVDERGKTIRGRSFLIPYIQAKSTGRKSFRIKAPAAENEQFQIIVGWEQPLGALGEEPGNTRASNANDEETSTRNKFDYDVFRCKMEFLIFGIIDAGINGIEWGLNTAPVISCVWGGVKTGYQTYMAKPEDRWITFTETLAWGAVGCAAGFLDGVPTIIGWTIQTSINAVANYQSAKGCNEINSKVGNIRSVQSYDPNEMIGPWGPDDDKHYIQPIRQMPYMITFENKSTATAPANEVFVTDTLDLTKFDAETFNFSSFGWADTTFVVGGSRTQEFTRDVNYKVNGHDILVRVSGQFNAATGVVNWSFASLEANGSELADVMNGFLLPNDQNGRGEGYVSFIIDHKANPANGSAISNKATIVFDANEPIVTNTYTNTFDTDYPTSKVTKAEEPSEGKLTVTVSGSDPTSGVDHYTVFAQKNGGEWLAVATITEGTTCTIDVETGTKYGLCAIATDRVGLNEPKDYKAETELTTSGNAPVMATYDLRVADAGYATFYDSKADYQLPAGLKASTVSGISGNRLTYQPLSGGIIPKATAVLIEATQKEAATYTLTATTASDGSPVGTNLLHGSDDATTTSDGSSSSNSLYYKLAYGPSNTSLATSFGWFWGAQQGAPFLIEAHRAWLAVPKSAGARAYLIDGEATGIDAAPTTVDGDQLYDLQGRRIDRLTAPGVYLLNRRKVVVK